MTMKAMDTMRIRPPEWGLRAVCPVCHQGSSVLVACPNCEQVVVICEEEGTAFIDTRAVSTLVAVDAQKTKGRAVLNGF